ncbi:hypothetical protein [Actinomycetospora sp. CA-053990]|uniref:hypothetical protein n=1 Tax=Actinomycetospora sp. CA-053990 TaxID=3239891 RepID=UPI003D8C35F9
MTRPIATPLRPRAARPPRTWPVALAAVAAVLVPVLGACSSPATPAVAAPPASSAPPASPAAPVPATGPPTSAGPPEVNPSGDIPDNQVYVPYPAPDGTFTVSVPEGWARSTAGGAVVFTDNLNAVRLETRPMPAAPTEAGVTAQDLPALQASVPGFVPGPVTTVTRNAGTAVLATYQAVAPPDPVTGRTRTDTIERYAFWHSGQELVISLSGPVGADNVDPWRAVTDSLRWMR